MEMETELFLVLLHPILMNNDTNFLGNKFGGCVEIGCAFDAALGFGMDGDIIDARQRQETAAHFIGNGVSILHGKVGSDAHMKVNCHFVGRAAAADAMEAFDPLYTGDDFANI